MSVFKRKSFCVVTGAGRGLGKEIAVQLSTEWSKEGVESDIVITSRTKEELEETKALINSQAPGIHVHIVTGDLSDTESLPALCTQLYELIDTSKHEQGVLVNNAGNLNDFDVPFLSRDDPKFIQDSFALNATSVMVLTTCFLSAFTGEYRYVVNITSVLASMFVPHYSLYSITRAARNAFMKSLAVEVPDVRILSYSPGPCDTVLLRSVPAEFKAKRVLSVEVSIKFFIELFKEDKYENAVMVDYYDGENLMNE